MTAALQRSAVPAAAAGGSAGAPAARQLRRACACAATASNEPCEECAPASSGLIQRRATGGGPPALPASVDRVLGAPGRPLDAGTREAMQARLGRAFGHDFARVPVRAAAPAGRLEVGPVDDAHEREAEAIAARFGTQAPATPDATLSTPPAIDFGTVRIHDDAEAAASARELGALAYTVGHHVVFGAGRYAPGSAAGQRLLAHELTHVVQQGAAIGPLRRAPDPTAGPGAAPGRIGLSVSLDGLVFEVPDDVHLKPGPRTPQLLAIVLQRLLGPAYVPGLEASIESRLKAGNFERSGGFKDPRPAKGGEPTGRIVLALRPALALLEVLEAKKLQTVLSEEQQNLLRLGAASEDLWADFNRTLKESELTLPRWYTRSIFKAEIGQHGALLKQYAEQLQQAREGQGEARTAARGTVSEVIAALYTPLMVVEAVRLDISLAANEKTQAAYASLWKLPAPVKGKPPVVTAPPTSLRNEGTMALFLGYLRTQSQLAANAEVYPDQRALLMERFGRFTQSLMFSPGASGDQQLQDQPSSSNRPAFPSSLHGVPEPPPPLFNAALGTDFRFSMQVEFPSVYEALGRYAFNWERVRIPDDKIGQPVDVTKLKGERPGIGEVASVRFGRDTRYAVADVQRMVDEMQSDLGAPGVGALELVGANAILRYVGTGIRLAFDVLTMPLDQTLIVFPSPGLYMVRASMSQVREGTEEIMRAPSVAYFPVLAREPDEMAAAGVKSTLDARQRMRERIAVLEKRLAGPVDASERPALQQELDGLRQAFAPVSTRLERQRADAEKLEKDIEAGRVEGDLEAASKAHKNLDKIIALRAKRSVGDTAEPLTARFVSDLGQTLALTMEVVDRSTPGDAGPARVYLSDITTPKSGDATGSGKTRDDAIAAAVKSLLESIHGYGRGRVSLALADGVRTVRIEAGTGALLVEAIDNVATALSVAAIAAAPFTGGASLSFLVPLGLVGAIPAAYRVVQRLEAGTFEFDLENALDLVNIAGSLIGLGRIGAMSLRSVRMGRALLVVGFGIDAAGGVLMGAQLLQQIDELSKLPPGERSSALLLLMGQTLMTAGVMVGGSLAERAQQAHAEAAEAARGKGSAGTTGEHPPGLGGDTAPKPLDPNISARFERAKVDAEMGRLGRMDPDSEAKLRADPALRQALVEQPLAAAALKKCNTPCYPPGVTERQVQRLDRLLARLADGGGYNEAALKEYLHARRGDLDAAITQIEGTKTGRDLNMWLDFYNGGGQAEKLPAKGDPALLLELRDRAHDIGVAKGRDAAKAGPPPLQSVGFQNPFERQGRYGQGFDDIMRTGTSLDTGDIYIVEYKGGDAQLAEGQMSLEWVLDNIRRLHATGHPDDQAWARTLAKAAREGRLKGVVLYTPLDGNAPRPTVRQDMGAYKLGNIKLGF